MISAGWGIVPLVLCFSFVITSVSPGMIDYMERGCNGMLSFTDEQKENCIIESQEVLDKHFNYGMIGMLTVGAFMITAGISNTYMTEEDEIESKAAI